MKKSTMTHLLHAVLIVGGALLIGFFVFFLPFYGQDIVRIDPEYAWAYIPCLIWSACFALPIFIALVPCWQIFSSISAPGGAFVLANAKRLKCISILALIDAFVFPIGMFTLAFMGAGSAPLTLLITPLVIFACLAVSLACGCLGKLVADAVALREENDLTV